MLRHLRVIGTGEGRPVVAASGPTTCSGWLYRLEALPAQTPLVRPSSKTGDPPSRSPPVIGGDRLDITAVALTHRPVDAERRGMSPRVAGY
jgi:hypothetical protein